MVQKFWRRVPGLSPLSWDKSFRDPWIGHPGLNRLGLHPARMVLADFFTVERAILSGTGGHPSLIRSLRRDGIGIAHNFLPSSTFQTLREEARHVIAQTEARRPARPGVESGFGAKKRFDGGFDRYDGSTLNRFLDLDQTRTPQSFAAVRASSFRWMMTAAAAVPVDPGRVQLYLTVQGQEAQAHDPQKDLHRDTFHRSVKFWLFLDEVTLEDGPFVYVPRSHRLSAARLRWEHAEARRSSHPDAREKGGAFRISGDGLAALGYGAAKAYPVPANTLVIADTRGFHARGPAVPGAQRLALYANLRFYPFTPLARPAIFD